PAAVAAPGVPAPPTAGRGVRAVAALLVTCAILAPAVASARTVPPAATDPAPAAIASSAGLDHAPERFARNRTRQAATPDATEADAGADAVLQNVGGQAVEAVDRIVGMPAAPTAIPTPAVDLAATEAAAT